MAQKITKEEFLNRFYKNYPEANISIIEYSAITKPCIVKCNICGKEYKKSLAKYFLSQYRCCGSNPSETKYEKIVKMYENNDNYNLVKKIDKDNVLVQHIECGNSFKRTIQSCLEYLESCPYCNTVSKKNMTDEKEVQKKLDNKFFGEIELIEYNGVHENNLFKCRKCGLIFKAKLYDLINDSRGCPKCDKIKSKGEKQLNQILIDNNIIFKEQVSVKELPRQHFDFGIYNENNELLYFIEVQGEQHFKESSFFDGLEKIQERDNRKRKYCKENNIPLYELLWMDKGHFINLNILPFLK